MAAQSLLLALLSPVHDNVAHAAAKAQVPQRVMGVRMPVIGEHTRAD